MTPWFPLAMDVVIVAAVLLGSVYVVAVLDLMLGALIARSSVRLATSVLLPLRTVSLLLLQRSTVTERPDLATWRLAPALLAAMAAATIALVPALPLDIRGGVPEGIVYFGGAMAVVMIAVYLNGWSANSPFPLIAGYRFVALALSYEMPLALVLIAAALPAQSLAISDIVSSQASLWNVVRQPLGLPLYLIAVLGLAFWGPLDVCDSIDLGGGTLGELSGPQRLMWQAARMSVLAAGAAMGAAVFLGGPLGPILPGSLWLALKTLALVVVLLVAGHCIPRVRLERFVVVAWVVLIPLALVDVFVSGLLALWMTGT